MKRISLIVILVLSLIVNASVLITVGYHYYRGRCLSSSAPCPLNRGSHYAYQELDLSSEQLAEMTALARSFHGRLDELQAAVETKRNLLIDALGENQIDLAGTESIRKEIAGYQDEIQKEVITHIAASKKIMNPDQQKRFISLLRTISNSGRFNSPFSANGGNP